MSYILDALRKSETERRQGKVPDLGQQVQLIHKPKKKGVSPVVWLSLALMINAGILAAVFWPRPESSMSSATRSETAAEDSSHVRPEPAKAAPQTPASPTDSPDRILPEDEAARDQAAFEDPEAMAGLPGEVSAPLALAEPQERPVIIVPSAQPERRAEPTQEVDAGGRVPHLVELPLSFQRSVPNLTFNSHIYSSDPFASRVMINSQYLRRGDVFSGLTVEDITEEGVIFSKQGQRFRVGIVRDWVSPR
ncbi:general secretion pathway protein GspB [Marinobacter salinisoli]|uniref:General secretion pathway protein GspB n=1 Tax=Marinobacter salinisoli TaxID=2769486 RepID=A0ABX7MNN6_9GAMM|nr:general secretion pathway protein GspB [Marinobacter salinisoli]QSP93724.1 general secretion pathway protein GspB [Marinobacter salinisoli]